MKKFLIAMVLVVGLATAGFVYARGGGYGMGGCGMNGYGMGGPGMMGPGMMDGYCGNGPNPNCPGAVGYGPDGWNSEKHQKFLDATVELRKQMNDKRFEY